jgi:hypothetical protein
VLILTEVRFLRNHVVPVSAPHMVPGVHIQTAHMINSADRTRGLRYANTLVQDAAAVIHHLISAAC